MPILLYLTLRPGLTACGVVASAPGRGLSFLRGSTKQRLHRLASSQPVSSKSRVLDDACALRAGKLGAGAHAYPRPTGRRAMETVRFTGTKRKRGSSLGADAVGRIDQRERMTSGAPAHRARAAPAAASATVAGRGVEAAAFGTATPATLP